MADQGNAPQLRVGLLPEYQIVKFTAGCQARQNFDGITQPLLAKDVGGFFGTAQRACKDQWPSIVMVAEGFRDRDRPF